MRKNLPRFALVVCLFAAFGCFTPRGKPKPADVPPAATGNLRPIKPLHPMTIEAPTYRGVNYQGVWVWRDPYACTVLGPGQLLFYSAQKKAICLLEWKDSGFIGTRLVPIEGKKTLTNRPPKWPRISGLTGFWESNGTLTIAWAEELSVTAHFRLAHCRIGQLPEVKEIWRTRNFSSPRDTPLFHFLGSEDVVCTFLDYSEEHWDWRTIQFEGWSKVQAIHYRSGRVLYAKYLTPSGSYEVEDFAALVKDDGSIRLAWVKNDNASAVDFSFYRQSFDKNADPIERRPIMVLKLPRAQSVIDYGPFFLRFLPNGQNVNAMYYGPPKRLYLYRLTKEGAVFEGKYPLVGGWATFADAADERGCFHLLYYDEATQKKGRLVLATISAMGVDRTYAQVPRGGFDKSVYLVDQPMKDKLYWLENVKGTLELRWHKIEHGSGDGAE